MSIAEAVLCITASVMAGGRTVAGEPGGDALQKADWHVGHSHPTTALEQEDPDQSEPSDGSRPKDAAGVDGLSAGHEGIILSNGCDL